MTTETTPGKSLAQKKEPSLTVEAEREAQVLSPFELKNHLIDLAKKAPGDYLNAGRGNPNFFNTTARLGLARLMEFALSFARKDEEHHLGYRPQSSGIAEAFDAYFSNHRSPGGDFLRRAMAKAFLICTDDKTTRDDVVWELVDAALGDFYPDPPIVLDNVGKIVNAYLNQVLLRGEATLGQFDLFTTEGATAGMVYVFKSLQENFLLNSRDKVAVVTPVFSPYLEIPQLNDFEFNMQYLDTVKDIDGHDWQLPDAQLDRLKDRSIKALYLINPTNPTSVALGEETINKLAAIVADHNPNLIIIVDAVYATFVDSYTTIISKVPRNCLVVYSFSKYFGVTGWRLGAIMLNHKNVIDRMIAAYPQEWKDLLHDRYSIDTEQPETIPFIERVLWDSRDVALAHTGGLSCPQQAAMALFALFDLLDQEEAAGEYRQNLWSLLRTRIRELYQALPIDPPSHHQHTYYYALIDVLELAEKRYPDDKDFPLYLVQNYYPVDFVFCLAVYTASVCLPGYGFFESETPDYQQVTTSDHNKWTIRVSLANLDTPSYPTLGRDIAEVLKLYHDEYAS